ncbi:MAG TPA: FixH family protein, partial [Polyangiales bacterium]
PATLHVLFVNANQVSLDQAVRMTRASPGLYRGACAALPEGRWRVAVEDDTGHWAIRGQHLGSLDGLVLRARNPEGGAR